MTKRYLKRELLRLGLCGAWFTKKRTAGRHRYYRQAFYALKPVERIAAAAIWGWP